MPEISGPGPYEREASELLNRVNYLLEEQQEGKKLSAAEKEWMGYAVEAAKAWAILNTTDELTRFINTRGITVNEIDVRALME